MGVCYILTVKLWEILRNVLKELIQNELDVLVATSALSMGFDKPDLGFVYHFQTPQSVVHYYQQVGRAGRAIPEAFGTCLLGKEDRNIIDYFIKDAFPSILLFTGTFRHPKSSSDSSSRTSIIIFFSCSYNSESLERNIKAAP